MEQKEQILINATQPEECRVAFVINGRLSDLAAECPSKINAKGSLYKGLVTRYEPSLEAAFVNYGGKRQGFLPLKEIAPEYLSPNPNDLDENRQPRHTLIREGQEILIQVDKEERGTKGAALTTYITLAGAYLVLMPNNPRSGGISRRIEGDERNELRETLNALELPEDMGLIIRTAGVGKIQEDLQDDLNKLRKQWQSIQNDYQTAMAPRLIHQEGDVITRSIRDNLRPTITEIIIDDHVSYIKAKQYIEQVKPEFLPRLKLYKNAIPLFIYFGIESQIETAYQRVVALRSGGNLVIDRTEALVSIDINSAKATSGSDIETTALNTNLEAADEIARQLRLRDLGGLVVIDFIDMSSSKNQRDVENRLKEALQTDRARIQIGRISRFGLLEMSRQRLRLSLGESAQEICPRCEGRGTVRNLQSHGLSITRLIEEEALKEHTAEIQVQLPASMATFIMNEKRDFINHIEKDHAVKVVIIANPYIQPPEYSIVRVKDDQASKHRKSSYALIEEPELQLIRPLDTQTQDPSIKPFEMPSKQEQVSFLKHLWNSLFGEKEETDSLTTTVKKSKTSVPATQKKSPRPVQEKQSTNQAGKKRIPNHHHQRPNNPNSQRKKNPNPITQRQNQSHAHKAAVKGDVVKKKDSAGED